MTSPTPPPGSGPIGPRRRPAVDYQQLGYHPEELHAAQPAQVSTPRLVVVPSPPPAASRQSAAVLGDPGLITHHPVATEPTEADLEQEQEQEQWWGEQDSDPPDPEASGEVLARHSRAVNPARRRTLSSRSGRVTSTQSPPVGKPVAGRAQSSGTRMLRRLLGLDRLTTMPTASARTAAESAASSQPDGGGAPQWLRDLETDETTLGEESAAALKEQTPPTGTEPADRTGTAAVDGAAGSERPAARDLEVSRAPRELGATVRRALIGLVLVLIAFAGVKQVIWNPIFGRTTAAVTSGPAVMDQVAADGAATRYALDYLSYSPADASAAATAVTADQVGGDITPARWAGTGYVRAEAALPGSWHVIDPAHAVVTVTVRVHLAMPPTTAKPIPAAVAGSPAPVPAGSASDPGAIPPGWTDLGSRWVTVAVPVQSSGGVVKVSSGGGVFTGEAPGLVTPDPAGSADPGTTAATQGVATSFLTAYAQSDVAYLAEPGVNLAGLSGTVTLASVTNWTVTIPPAPISGTTAVAAASGVGTAVVTWQLAGTDLQIAQSYAIALTNSQSRWYIAALSPVVTTTSTQ
jgi:hypothetical protein